MDDIRVTIDQAPERSRGLDTEPQLSERNVTTATVFVPVKAPEDLPGFADLMAALAVYEPTRSHVVAVCDGPIDAMRTIALASDVRIDVIPHPGAGQGHRGTCSGTLAGLAYATRLGNGLVVKLDCDALVIGPFVARLEQLFADNPSAGIVGAIHRDRGQVIWGRAVRRLGWPIAVWRQTRPGYRRVVPLLSGPRRRAAEILRQARKAGWPPGLHCQGGAYAVSGELVKVLKSAGVLDRPLDWLDVPLSEDVMMSALAAAFGFELRDASHTGEPFGVYWQRLPGPAPEMITQQHALIHSVRMDPDGRSELELRKFFAARRDETCDARHQESR